MYKIEGRLLIQSAVIFEYKIYFDAFLWAIFQFKYE